jgi:hypothetical protein
LTSGGAAELESWARRRPAASTSSSVTWWTAWTYCRAASQRPPTQLTGLNG